MDILKAVSGKEASQLARAIRHMGVVREHWASIVYMKEALQKDDQFMFLEAWEELGHEVQTALWVAPTKGGIWTTKERTTMRSWGA